MTFRAPFGLWPLVFMGTIPTPEGFCAASLTALYSKGSVVSKHYRIDQAHVRRTTQRDKASEIEQAKEFGFYTYTVMKIVPIKKIKVPPVWHQGRIKQIREALTKRTPLPPIELHDAGGRYEISDGIHRTNASIEEGFTHIPAYFSVAVERPDLYEQPEPEKPKLAPGTWVKFRDPKKNRERFPWALIVEYVGPRSWKGARRHVYGLVGGNNSHADWIGDWSDDQFDPVRENQVPAKTRDRILDDHFAMDFRKSATRVAMRWTARS